MGQNGGAQRGQRSHKWKSVANREVQQREKDGFQEILARKSKVRAMLFQPFGLLKQSPKM